VLTSLNVRLSAKISAVEIRSTAISINHYHYSCVLFVCVLVCLFLMSGPIMIRQDWSKPYII